VRIDRYLSFLERVLTPKRLQHSIGVMQVMEELAQVYSLDRDKAVLAGLLHDAAKDLAPARQTALVEEGGIEIRHACEGDWDHYLHGPVGAYFIYKELGVTDTLILDAVSMHTYYGDGETAPGKPLQWALTPDLCAVRYPGIILSTQISHQIQQVRRMRKHLIRR
jgi:putative nucleotidyltransferase with HDIG domain